MTRNMHRLLAFALRYPGWHSCARDSQRAMGALEARGYLEVMRYEKALPQFRIALPARVFAAVAAVEQLRKAESFISGFEGDELQEGIADLLAGIRDAIAKAEGAS